MKKSELNKIIAKYFGFKESKGKKYLCDGHPQWSYPSNWYFSQPCIPNLDIPDFVTMLEDYLKLFSKHSNGTHGLTEWLSLHED